MKGLGESACGTTARGSTSSQGRAASKAVEVVSTWKRQSDLGQIGVVVGGKGLSDIPGRTPSLIPALVHFALAAFNLLALA